MDDLHELGLLKLRMSCPSQDDMMAAAPGLLAARAHPQH
jgi:hypothetical protein